MIRIKPCFWPPSLFVHSHMSADAAITPNSNTQQQKSHDKALKIRRNSWISDCVTWVIIVPASGSSVRCRCISCVVIRPPTQRRAELSGDCGAPGFCQVLHSIIARLTQLWAWNPQRWNQSWYLLSFWHVVWFWANPVSCDDHSSIH